MVVDVGISPLVRQMIGLGKITIGPKHLAFQSVDAAKRTIAKRQDGGSLLLGDGIDLLLFGQPHLPEAEETMLERLAIQKITALAIDDNPHILVGIDEHLVRFSINANRLQPFLRISVKSLIGILVDAIAHARMYPKVAIDSLHHFVDGVVGKRTRIEILVKEVFESETVVAVQPRLSAKPNISPVILQDGVDLTIAQSVAIGQVVELQFQMEFGMGVCHSHDHDEYPSVESFQTVHLCIIRFLFIYQVYIYQVKIDSLCREFNVESSM